MRGGVREEGAGGEGVLLGLSVPNIILSCQYGGEGLAGGAAPPPPPVPTPLYNLIHA